MIKNILITGKPKSGKSTLLKKLIREIPSPHGFITNEMTENGQRYGFEIETSAGEKFTLAQVNFETKFKNWANRMNKKSEKEKHNYALTVAFLLTAVVFFFVASSWYFRISGESYDTSIFTDLENIFNNQKNIFNQRKNEIIVSKDQIMNTFSGSHTLPASSTNATTTVTTTTN